MYIIPLLKGDVMEPLFENRFYGTHRMMAEFFRKYGVGPRPVVTAITAAVFVLSVIHSILWGVFVETFPMLFAMGGILTAVYFVPDLFAWSSMRHSKQQNDGVFPETVITFGDAIELREGMIHLTVEYRKITRVIRLKHSYVLMLGKRNGVIIDPNGFSRGDFPSFKAFLREKLPDLKIPE
jgi:hypothetical protein